MLRHEAYPSTYLGQADIEDDLVLTIAGIEMRELRNPSGGMDEKPVVDFKETNKQFVLNSTNWDVIEELYGENSDRWVGKAITLFVDPAVSFGNKRVGGVRIRPNKPPSLDPPI